MVSRIKQVTRFNLGALQWQNFSYYNQHKGKLGLSLASFLQLKRYSSFYKRPLEVQFFDTVFNISSPFWFLHSVDEIFLEEVYRFKADVEDPTIIDCGANIGLSIIYFKRLYPKAKILAFEADPGICNILKKNVEVFGFSDANIVHSAVWDENSTLSFAQEGSVGGKIGDAGNGSEMIKVPAIRLSDYLNKPVDFLKIDIEGAEYRVLKDCWELLSNVKNLFIEYHLMPGEQSHLHEILNWVQTVGFSYYIKEAWSNMDYPFMKEYKDTFQLQLNISCFR